MSMEVRFTYLDESYWSAGVTDLTSNNILSVNPTVMFAVNPTTIFNNGYTKTDILPPATLNSLLQMTFVTPHISVVASEWSDFEWAAWGWTPNDQSAFLTEVGVFLKNNLSQPELNPLGTSVDCVVMRGNFGGTDYSVILGYLGNRGQLLDFQTSPSRQPITGTFSTGVAIDSTTGYLWSWGGNGPAGLLGRNGSENTTGSPKLVSSATSFVKVSGGSQHVAALDSSGSLYIWGSNNFGALGLGDMDSRSTPILITSPKFIDVVAGTSFTFAVEKESGQVYGWGDASNGGLGFGNSFDKSSPQAVIRDRGFKQLAAGQNIFLSMLTHDGEWWYQGNLISEQFPLAVLLDNSRSYTAVAATATAAFALASDGSAWAVGYNTSGVLGDGTNGDSSTPVAVMGGHSFTAIAGHPSGNTMLALDGMDGSAWAWGEGLYGKTGVGDTTNQSTPVSVLGGRSFVAIATGVAASYGLEPDGTLWSWGVNNFGDVVEDVPLGNVVPTSPSSASAIQFVTVDGSGSSYNSYGVDQAGQVWSWGDNSMGQLGVNDFNPSFAYAPLVIVDPTSYVAVSSGGNAAAAIRGDGTVWTWGTGDNGVLGNNSTGFQLSPVSAVGGRSFSAVAVGAGGQMVALESSTGNVYAWGSNLGGKLGVDDTDNRSSPTSVVGGMSFFSIFAGGSVSGGIMGDGSAWCWGGNSAGQLGDNTTDPQSSPVMVMGGHTFTQISGKSDSVAAIDDAGKIWMWGLNNLGQLGYGNTTDYSTPVSVMSSGSFIQVSNGSSHTLAIEGSTGYVYSWGGNSFGQLGTGDVGEGSSSPVSVIGGRSYSWISAGSNFSSGLSDGTLYTWGFLDILGNGSRRLNNSPVSVLRVF